MENCQPNNSEILFHKYLTVISNLCKFELDETTLLLYDKHLSSFGYDKLCVALDKIMCQRNSRDPFPSIAFIESIINPTISHDKMGQTCVDDIVRVFKQDGPNLPKTMSESDLINYLTENIGTLGIAVLSRMGGYNSLYNDWGNLKLDQVPTFKAQLRRTAESLCALAAQGIIDSPIALPKPRAAKSSLVKVLWSI